MINKKKFKDLKLKIYLKKRENSRMLEDKQQNNQEEEEHIEEEDVFQEDGLAPLPRGDQSLSPFSAEGKPEGGGGGRRGRKISLFNVNEQVSKCISMN